jgi:hypothetical protein
MGGVPASVVVESDPVPDASLGLRAGFTFLEAIAFMALEPPAALDEGVAEATA